MKISEQWLREWVAIPCSIKELAESYTKAGIEVEGIESVAGEFSNVVIGQILDAKQHENAERLRICSVDIGKENPLQIVCGAANARAGIKVAVAVVGAVLPGNFSIKEAKLRGVISQGMLCSAKELGMSDATEGIIELGEDAPIGEDIRQWLTLNDTVIEFSITPNRGDCLSVMGLAREAAALLKKPEVTFPDLTLSSNTTIEATFPVTINSSENCPHYVGRIIKNINTKAKTPLWMLERLRRSGLKAISPIVDVTNYVLLELGQPLHAFDLEKLQGKIIVRQAQEGETLTLLDGQNVTLKETALVIADEQRPLALAGIMGGLSSAITDETQDIFLESAYFNPLAIVGKSREYGIQTDSAFRFERGVDPTLQRIAIERATTLILAIAGGSAGPITETSHQESLPKVKIITLRRKRIKQILGFEISNEEIYTILNTLGMEITIVPEGWEVKIPFYRFDLAIEVDLIEELARIKGYDEIPTHYPVTINALKPASEKSLSLKRMRELLTDRGYREVITYSFVDQKLHELLLPNQKALTLLNPMSSEMAEMRMSLWPGLIQTLQYNQNRQQNRIRIYETGLCFNQTSTGISQEMHLGGIVWGSLYPDQWSSQTKTIDFYDVKSDIEALLQFSFNGKDYHFQPCEHPALHPGQSTEIQKNGKTIGYLGKIHPEIEQKLDINGNLYLFELNIMEIMKTEIPSYQAISKFPSIRRDLAILVEKNIPAEAIQQTIFEEAGYLLQSMHLFDVYEGKGIPEGYKSLALGLTLTHQERTLVEDEVNELIHKIIETLKQNYNAELRV